MRLLYALGIRIYWLAAVMISPWNRKAGLWVRGRRGWYKRMKAAVGPKQKVIWFHCASLGEFEQGRPIIEAIRELFPHHKILLTFFSPSGYEKRKDYAGADYVMYLPLDTRRNAKKMVDLLSPEMVLFIKYEFWYHFLKRLKVEGVPVYLASGNFRSGQLFFRWYGGWYRRFLELFTEIFVQNSHSRELLAAAGIHRVTVAGDTRFDRVHELATSRFNHPAIENFTKGHKVIVAGSTWEKDEKLLEQVYREMTDVEVRWIIAPHEISDGHIRNLQERFPGSVLYTELVEVVPEGTRVILVDTIGRLSNLYRYGTLAYIGGGFGKGIHNILEAATFGLPVIFGPNYRNFSEAVELRARKGAFVVSGAPEMLSTVCQQLENPKLLKTTSDIASNYVKEKLGATSKIIQKVCKK